MINYRSTYQALVDDVLDHRLNRVTVQMEGKNGQGKRAKTYDVDAESVSGNLSVPDHEHLSLTKQRAYGVYSVCRQL